MHNLRSSHCTGSAASTLVDERPLSKRAHTSAQIFNVCLTFNHKKRLNIHDGECLEFYKDINSEPPHCSSGSEVSIGKKRFNFDPFDGAALLSEPYPTQGPKRPMTQITTTGSVLIISLPMRLVTGVATQMPHPPGFESFVAEWQKS